MAGADALAMSTEYAEDDFRELAETQDVVARLRETTRTAGIHPHVAESVVIQLTGGLERTPDLGSTRRGDIHVAAIAGSTVNLSRFLSVVADLAPNSMTINGASATRAGVVGSASGGSLESGPLLDDETEFLVVDGKPKSGAGAAFKQVFDTGEYSFATANYRETISAKGSVLFGVQPKYGVFDEHEPIGEQIDLPTEILGGLDLVVASPVERENETSTDDAVEALPADLARQYIAYARSLAPSSTPEVDETIDAAVERWTRAAEDADMSIGISRKKASLQRLATAYAKLRLSDEVAETDAKRAITLMERMFDDLGIPTEPEPEPEFDPDVVETGTSKSQRDRIKNFKQLISQLEEEYESGAPRDELEHRAKEEYGWSADRVAHMLDKLFQKGEAYQPAEDHYRTT